MFSLMLASPIVRMMAWLIDVAAITAMTIILRIVLVFAFVISSDFMMALSIIIAFLVTIGYSILLEWLWNGQTLGKRMLRLRVVDEGGHRLHFSQIVVRNLLRFVDALPASVFLGGIATMFFYFLGGITMLFNSRGQRLGDLAAGTVVVRQPAILAPDVDQIGGMKYNSFGDHPYLEARLCSQVTPHEASLALSALLRRNDFDDSSRLKVFRELAEHFQELVKFPPEITEDISDEQYVRNVVCSVYRLADNGTEKNNARKDDFEKDGI